MSDTTEAVPDFREQSGQIDVRVLRVPLKVMERSSQHNAELLREFRLISLGERGGRDLPQRLLALMDALEARYAGVSAAPMLERQAALAAGRLSVDLEYHVPSAAIEACRTLLEMLTEADAFCAGGLLMTLPQPPDQQAFNAWYLGEFLRQADGEPPLPWPGSLD